MANPISISPKQKQYRRARLLMEHVLALGLPQKQYDLAVELKDKIDELIQWEEGVDYLTGWGRKGRGRGPQ
jgi:hypothetical protein